MSFNENLEKLKEVNLKSTTIDNQKSYEILDNVRDILSSNAFKNDLNEDFFTKNTKESYRNAYYFYRYKQST